MKTRSKDYFWVLGLFAMLGTFFVVLLTALALVD